jgi:hypothetical protein
MVRCRRGGRRCAELVDGTLRESGSLLRALELGAARDDRWGMSNETEKTPDDHTTGTESGNSTPETFDGPDDNTVENSEEMGGGYGGPAPVNPEDEQA